MAHAANQQKQLEDLNRVAMLRQMQAARPTMQQMGMVSLMNISAKWLNKFSSMKQELDFIFYQSFLNVFITIVYIFVTSFHIFGNWWQCN